LQLQHAMLLRQSQVLPVLLGGHTPGLVTHHILGHMPAPAQKGGILAT
jgi:hypothetical protein